MTVTKMELANTLFEELGLNKREAKEFVELFFEEIRTALERGHTIKFSGFGSFSTRDKPARPGRNPKTGAAVRVDAKYVPHFKPGRMLRERVNHGLTGTTHPATPGDPITR